MDDVERLLWWLFQSSAGAATRFRLVGVVRRQPGNAQQIADALGMDYSTIQHHLRILVANHLLDAVGDHYGRVYFLSSSLESRWAKLEAIAGRSAKTRGGA